VINKQYVEDLKWWKEKLRNYEELDGLSDKEARRLMFCFCTLMVNALEPEDEGSNETCCDK